jgi:hypothetical protein
MKTPEATMGGQSERSEEEPGVLGYRVENNHYVVDVRWKDGEKSENHFPIAGFTVVNPKNNECLGKIRGEKALEILQQHAGEYTREDFSWRDFV